MAASKSGIMRRAEALINGVMEDETERRGNERPAASKTAGEGLVEGLKEEAGEIWRSR